MRTFLLFASTLALFGQVKPSLMEDAGRENLPSQKLGVDDLIAVSVYDAPELTRTLRVEEDGTIHLPLLKEGVKASGMFARQLETSIAAALKIGADSGGPGREGDRGGISQPADFGDGRGAQAADVSGGRQGDAARRAGARRGTHERRGHGDR